MGDACARFCQQVQFLIREVDAVGVPDIVPDPAEGRHIRQGAQTAAGEGVVLLVLCFAKVRMQAHTVLPRKNCRLPQQLRRDGEGRAGCKDNLPHRAKGGVMIRLDHMGAVLQNCIDALHYAVRRQPAVFHG